jgi:hypothetical protein
MKEIIGLVTNIQSSWKTTVLGGVFISVFIYDYVTATEQIELVSIDAAILAMGVSLLLAPDKIK